MSIIKAAGAGEVSGDFYSYKINQSLRFDDDTSHHLTITPGSDGNRKTWTYSFWFKHGSKTAIFDLLLANGGSDPFFEFSLTAAQKFQIFYHNETMLVSTMALRDRSAWYHIVVRHDTTQATANNRLRIYVNSVEVDTWDTNGRANLPQDFDGGVNQAIAHFIGQNHVGGNTLDGYMAEVHLVDGSSLAPSSFGETKDGTWVPKEYSGSHGTNGFYLPFDDSSAIGDDESSNTNDLTANNFAASDVVKDSPTNNFATLNPTDPYSGTISEGNLKYNNGASFRAARGTFQIPTSGKWYFEVLNTAATSGSSAIFAGVAHPNTNISAQPNNGSTTGFYGIYNDSTLGILSNGSQSSSTSNTVSADSILQFAIDADNNKLYVGINDSYYSDASTTNGDPGAGSNPTESVDLAGYHPFVGAYSNTGILNTGQDPSFAGEITAGTATPSSGAGVFKHTPPSGFIALCSANLPVPEIIDGSQYFGVSLWTGDGSDRSITGLNFSPDWVWTKSRNVANSHYLFDSVRGVLKALKSDSTDAESTQADSLESFTSDGYTLGTNTNVNVAGGYTFVGWSWLAGTAFSNDASATGVGSIDSEGEVNTTAGFSIIKYTGTGSAGTIAHGLEGVPKFYTVKNRDDAGTNWQSYHAGVASDPETDYIYLNSNASVDDADDWNDTAPTSSVFSVKTHNQVNASGDTYIAYLFAEIVGYSKIGNYTGTGSSSGTSGPFVYCGFRPAWILIKCSSHSSTSWFILDTTRDPFNEALRSLSVDAQGGEAAYSGNFLDILSNGFSVRTSGTAVNGSGRTYIFLAFAETPFNYANAR